MAYSGRGANDLDAVDKADDNLVQEGERLGQHLGGSKTYFRDVLEKKTGDSVSVSGLGAGRGDALACSLARH